MSSTKDKIFEKKRYAFDLVFRVVAPHSNVKARKLSSLWGTEGTMSILHVLISKLRSSAVFCC